MKITKQLFTVLLMSIAFNPFANAQITCSNTNVTAAPICDYLSIQNAIEYSILEVHGDPFSGTATNYFIAEVKLFLNGNTTPVAQLSMSNNSSISIETDLPHFKQFLYTDINISTLPNDLYVLEIQYQIQQPSGLVYYTCVTPAFNIGRTSQSATAGIEIHDLSPTQVASGSSSPETSFYANEPITLDFSSSQSGAMYYVRCTPVNANGTPIGTAQQTPLHYFPSVLLADQSEFYIDLKSAFTSISNASNNSSGVNFFLIEYFVYGCDGPTGQVSASSIIDISNQIQTNPGDLSPGFGMIQASVYPNPGTGVFTCTTDELQDLLEIEVHDLMGKLILKKEKRAARSIEFDISNQPDGVYLVKTLVNGNITVNRIVLQ